MVTAILVAAGSGTRMGADKLFLPVAGCPIVGHTWRRFDQSPCIGQIILVTQPEKREAFEHLAATLQLTKPWRIVAGGAQRQDSVWNGLQAVTTEWVAIQDAARPCTSAETIERTLAAARQSGAAVAAQKVTDTLKEADAQGRIARNVDRTQLWSVQTPQVFRTDIIRRALAEVRQRGLHVTDDTAACEIIGQSVVLVECVEPNPKVTTPADLPLVETLLRGEALTRG